MVGPGRVSFFVATWALGDPGGPERVAAIIEAGVFQPSFLKKEVESLEYQTYMGQNPSISPFLAWLENEGKPLENFGVWSSPQFSNIQNPRWFMVSWWGMGNSNWQQLFILEPWNRSQFFSEQKRKHPDDVGELGQVLDGMQSFNRALPKSEHFAGRASAVGSHQRPLHLVHFSLTVKSWTGQKWNIAYG